MMIDGVKNVQAPSYQAPQPKVAENVNVENTKPVMEDIKVNTNSAEDTGAGNREVSNEQLKKTVADMNKKMLNTACQYGIHEGTGRVTIKIVDKDTKDVIKEFPAEETLELIAKAWELAGIMVDEKL